MPKKSMVYVFTPREILERINALLYQLGYSSTSEATNEMREYILARCIESIYLVSMYPARDLIKDQVYYHVRNGYVDEASGFYYNLDQDVGSNTLFPVLRSTGLQLSSRVKVQKFQVTIFPEAVL